MGAWGFNTFEDDIALDLLYELTSSDQPDQLIEELLSEANTADYLDADVGAGALVACEAVYATSHRPRGNPPDEFVQWVKAYKDKDFSRFYPAGLSGLQRLTAKDSELNELWQENEELYPEWRENIDELIRAFAA